ncbi:serine/threonine protein kinase [Streptacidiphilus sp. BW17]|uniref:serine/threonine-protein kinase n=1 Tax=Streptacidiphilus sp. BW17 TaxID=3156274 RepID=UPI00351193C0
MEPGDVLGNRYELLKVKGRGGMADVWEAEDLLERRQVAVKFLRADCGPSDSLDEAEWQAELERMRGRFRREGALLGKLHHQGIPELYDQGNHRSEPFIVMRLVKGKDLHRFLDQYTPTIAVAAAIGFQIADALACAHDLPVVHRDLKPYNLIVDEDGIIVLIDFGIAKPLWPGVTDYTPDGSTVGSRGYEAPEQILERQITPKTDLYALGCVLYRLLTGRPPFSGERLRDQHVHDKPVPLSHHVEHIPPELEALTLKLLEKDPDDRPEDAHVVREVLRVYAPREGDPAPSPRLEPDPTGLLRKPDSYQLPTAAAVSRVAPARRRRRDVAFLSRRSFRDLCVQAQSEIDTGDPGDVLERLADILPTARRDWGPSDPHVREAYRLAANGMRIAGRYTQALSLYDDLVRQSQDSLDPSDVADFLDGTLGAAECRIPFGELLPALQALTRVVAALPGLAQERAIVLAERCREVGLELTELGFDERVAAALPRLGTD